MSSRPDITKIPVLAALVSVTVILVGLFVFKIFLLDTSISDQSSLEVQDAAFTTPVLPVGFEWQEVPATSQRINKLKWVNTVSGEFGKILLTGKEWALYKSVSSAAEEYTSGIYETFTKDLTAPNGWEKSFSSIDQYSGYSNLIFDDFQIQGGLLSPTQTNYTFARVINNRILIVNYQEFVDEKFRIKHPSSVDYTYPHPREFRIFISDIITVGNLLDKRIETAKWLDD